MEKQIEIVKESPKADAESKSNNSCPTCHRPFKKTRSLSQNRYYWSTIVKTLSEELGYETEEVHDMIKYKFLSEERFIKGRESIVTVVVSKSTTELDTKEWEELMRKIRTWASCEIGICLPDPNEAYETN